MKFLTKLLCFVITFLIFIGTTAYSQTDNSHNKRVVVFIIDRININDYETYDLPNIKYLIENGTYGLSTVNSDGGKIPENIYTTIGAGTRAVGSDASSGNFNADEIINGEPASVIFERNTGIKPKNSNIINLDISQIKRNNQKSNHIVVPGLFGDLLKSNGKRIAVYGNEDTDKEQKRFAPLIAMNSDGIVDFGDVSDNILKEDVMSPFGIMTDYEKMYEDYAKASQKADVVLFQLGDTSRADAYAKYASDKINNLNRKKALENADAFIGRVIREGNIGTLYMVVTPMPSSSDISNKNFVTPIIIFGQSFTKGYLTSETTKRNGIVTNTDIMPTILKYFNINIPSYVTGHPLYNSGQKGSLNELVKENQKLVYNYTYRTPFLKTYATLQIIIYILALVMILFFKKASIYLKPLLFFITAIPLAFLMLPIFNYTNVSNSIVEVFFLIAVLIIGIYELSPHSNNFYPIISFVTVLALSIDLVTGQNLLKNSFLSYDAIGGARFYGIGNEYMGVMIGATLCFTSAIYQLVKNKKIAFFMVSITYALVFYLMAAPNIGTKVGGGITAFGGFVAALLMYSNKKVNIKNLILIGVGIILMLTGLFYLDSLRPPSLQTHIGQTFNLVKSQGVEPLIQIFSRKLMMNYKLITYSIWSRVFITVVGVLSVFYINPKGILNNILKQNKYIRICVISTIISCILALAFNDSGIIAATTMTVFIGPMLIHYIIEESV